MQWPAHKTLADSYLIHISQLVDKQNPEKKHRKVENKIYRPSK